MKKTLRKYQVCIYDASVATFCFVSAYASWQINQWPLFIVLLVGGVFFTHFAQADYKKENR